MSNTASGTNESSQWLSHQTAGERHTDRVRIVVFVYIISVITSDFAVQMLPTGSWLCCGYLQKVLLKFPVRTSLWIIIFNLSIHMLQTRKSGRKRESRKWQWEEWKWEMGKCLLCSPFLRSHWSLYVIFNKGWIDIILYLTPRRVYVASMRVISPLLSDSLQLTEA